MQTRILLTALMFMNVQAIVFGIGAVLVLATPLSEWAMALMPVVVAASVAVSLPLSWLLAPRLRARYWRLRAAREARHAGQAADGRPLMT